MNIELLHFCFSPYNEKVRWALDIKKLTHRRTSLLPGPHVRQVRRLTGQTATPVLQLGEKWIVGSGNILAALDNLQTSPQLIPEDEQQKALALEIQRKFDDDWGPRIRRVVISALMNDTSDLVSVFSGHKSAFVRLPYRCVIPLAKPLIAKGNDITGPASIKDGETAIAEAMEFVADSIGDSGFLVGDSLSIADIAAASTLAPVMKMQGTPMELPINLPPPLVEINSIWETHPGAVWVNEMFTRHRGTGMPSDGTIEYN